MAIELVCSFCGSSQEASRRLIGGPNGAAICERCVALCAQALDVGTPPSSDRGEWRATVIGTETTDRPTD